MRQGRGQLTARIKKKSKEILGYAVDQCELRFMVYIQYVMTNEQRTKRELINPEEGVLLDKWEEAGHVKRSGRDLKVTKEFWDILSEIIYLGYVDITQE